MAVTESFIGVPGTSEKLDSTTVTTGVGAVKREAVFISDPETAAARAGVVNSTPSSSAYGLVAWVVPGVEVHSLTDVFAVTYHGSIHNKTATLVSVIGSRPNGWSSTSVLGDACEYLDTSQATMNTPTSGQTLYLVSTSANDAAAGTGARTVRTVYLDSSGNQQIRTDTLNGKTPVSIGTGYTAIQWMEVATVGSGGISAGNLSISSTNGVATVATTFERVSANGNRSLSGRYKIPTGYSGYVLSWSCSAISATMDSRLRVDCFTDDGTLSEGVYHFIGRMFLSAGQNGNEDVYYRKIPAGSTIKVSSIPGSAPAGNKLDVGFSLVLVAN